MRLRRGSFNSLHRVRSIIVVIRSIRRRRWGRFSIIPSIRLVFMGVRMVFGCLAFQVFVFVFMIEHFHFVAVRKDLSTIPQ